MGHLDPLMQDHGVCDDHKGEGLLLFVLFRDRAVKKKKKKKKHATHTAGMSCMQSIESVSRGVCGGRGRRLTGAPFLLHVGSPAKTPTVSPNILTQEQSDKS